MASTSLEEIAALTSPFFSYTTHEGHARMQPVALTTPLTVPTFTGQNAKESVVDFIDDLSTFRTAWGLLELDVLQRVLPAALRGAAAQWLRFQSWDTFMAALQAEFWLWTMNTGSAASSTPLTEHSDKGLSAYIRAKQQLFRRSSHR
ncbi:hypothetical protein MTO96_045320 [Rhipicephalus appendiculatus]